MNQKTDDQLPIDLPPAEVYQTDIDREVSQEVIDLEAISTKLLSITKMLAECVELVDDMTFKAKASPGSQAISTSEIHRAQVRRFLNEKAGGRTIENPKYTVTVQSDAYRELIGTLEGSTNE